MRFSQEFIDKVRDATNIVEIISQHSQLKRSGSGLTGLCPFPDHREKTASFSVSDTKQAFYCFGCKRGGNVFTFLRDFQGLSFGEAVEVLAERANISIPRESQDNAHDREDEKRKAFLKLNRDVALFYHDKFNALPESHPAKIYAKKRGLLDETLTKFMIGFAPDSWDDLAKNLKTQPKLELAEALGLVKPRKGGDGMYDIFRNRLMFPIISPVGEVLGFGGRILDDNQPKYLNSSDSPVFSKGRVFYGLNEASKFLRSEDSAVVVEGYMDFLALFQAGVHNVVATLGTALTEDHARLLKRYTKNVIVLFDGDAAGVAATDRSLPILLKGELLPRGLSLPDQLDPDEYVQKVGAAQLKSELAQAPDLFVSFITRLNRAFGARSTDKVRLMEKIKPILAIISDERLRDLYVEEIATKLGMASAWVQKSFKSREQVTAPVNQKIFSKINTLNHKPPNEEVLLLSLSLLRQEYLNYLIEAQILTFIESPVIKELLSRVIQLYGQRPNDFDRLTSILSSQIDDPSLLTQHLDPKLNGATEEQGQQLLRDCIQRVKQRHLKSQAKAIVDDLKAEQDPKKLEQFVNILRDRRALEKE